MKWNLWPLAGGFSQSWRHSKSGLKDGGFMSIKFITWPFSSGKDVKSLGMSDDRPLDFGGFGVYSVFGQTQVGGYISWASSG